MPEVPQTTKAYVTIKTVSRCFIGPQSLTNKHATLLGKLRFKRKNLEQDQTHMGAPFEQVLTLSSAITD